MRISVTGGAGFIGSHLVDALLAAGHEVQVLDNLASGKRENVPAAVTFDQQDITAPAAATALQNFAPQAVFHLAAQMDVRHSVRAPVFDADVNVAGTVRMLHAAAAAGCGFFALASTGGAIYGEQDAFPADETHPTRPTSPYGVSKLCGEHYLRYFARHHGVRTVALRFANVYGPRQDPHGEAGVVAIFCGKLLAGQAPTINGDGEQTRDYVHVSDVARACIAAMEHTGAHGPYNVGTGRETSVNRLARLLGDYAGHTAAFPHAPAQPGEQQRSVVCPERARRELGWTPQLDVGRGLAQTFDWFRAQHAQKNTDA